MKPYHRPARWMLYLLYGAMLGLLFGEVRLPVTEGWHKLLEIAIVGATLGLMALWARRNRVAVAQEPMPEELERRSGERRDVPLTAVQACSLVAARPVHQRNCYVYRKNR